eukprot:3623989-Amphidinium_carterae.1
MPSKCSGSSSKPTLAKHEKRYGQRRTVRMTSLLCVFSLLLCLGAHRIILLSQVQRNEVKPTALSCDDGARQSTFMAPLPCTGGVIYYIENFVMWVEETTRDKKKQNFTKLDVSGTCGEIWAVIHPCFSCMLRTIVWNFGSCTAAVQRLGL